jgi:hypothetical protein
MLLIEFQNQVTDPSRPRLTRVECNVDTDFYDSSLWLNSGETAGEAIEQLLSNGSVPSGALTVNSGTPVVDGITTAADRVWTVVSDMAEYCGCFVEMGLDSRIVVKPETLFSTVVGAYTPADTWTRTDVSRVEKVFVRGFSASQVRLSWRNGAGSEDGTALYPSSVYWQGLVHEEGPLIYASVSAAERAAEKKYFLLRVPYTVLCELAEGDLTVKPGMVLNVEWDFHSDFGKLDRLYWVTSVDHVVENMHVTTIVNGIQIDREDAH